MKITEFVSFPPSFRLFMFLSFSFLHCSVSVRYCMHHFRFESIFFLGSSLSISENFKMHCNILAPDGWLAGFSWFVRQPYWDTRFIHLHTHTRHCIASHSVVSFLDNIHFASMKHAQHTLHMSSRCECVCVSSRAMYSNTFQWNGYRFTWMEIAIVFWPISWNESIVRTMAWCILEICIRHTRTHTRVGSRVGVRTRDWHANNDACT